MNDLLLRLRSAKLRDVKGRRPLDVVEYHDLVVQLRAEIERLKAERLVLMENWRSEEAKAGQAVEALKDTRAILRNDPTPVGAAIRRVEAALADLAAAKGKGKGKGKGK